MIRLYAPHRKRPPPQLHTYARAAYDEAQESFVDLSAEALANYSVVICTTRHASALSSSGVQQGFFTHIVVDEAAQLMEAEALLPLSLAGPSTQVIMAGDPQQLGPHTFSKVESVHGLHTSIMERLSGLAEYRADSPHLMRLTHNYRSHPTLVSLLSQISYDGTLVAKAQRERVDVLAGWPKRGTDRAFPVLFCSVRGGAEEREHDSPSLFNTQELTLLVDLVCDLVRWAEANQVALAPERVGVLSPYIKQTQRLRQTLRSRNLGRVRVGSTEEFHGLECDALFLSTTRTSETGLVQDEHFDMGFVGSTKRFNTALSRASCLVVVVGDSALLSHAPEWVTLIEQCRRNGSYIEHSAAGTAAAGGGGFGGANASVSTCEPVAAKPAAVVAGLEGRADAARPRMNGLHPPPAELVPRVAVLQDEASHAACELRGPLPQNGNGLLPPMKHAAVAKAGASPPSEEAQEGSETATDETPEWFTAAGEPTSPSAAQSQELAAASVEEDRVLRHSTQHPSAKQQLNGVSPLPLPPSSSPPPQQQPPPQQPQPQPQPSQQRRQKQQQREQEQSQQQPAPAAAPQAAPAVHGQLSPPFAEPGGLPTMLFGTGYGGCCPVGFAGGPSPVSEGFAVCCQHSLSPTQSMYAPANGVHAAAGNGAALTVQQSTAAALEAEASLYSQPPPAAAIDEPESVMLYAYGGQGLLFCTGDPPAYAVYDRPDELEIVISTFNMVPEFGPVAGGFNLQLAPDVRKAGEAEPDHFRTAVNRARGVGTGGSTLLQVVVAPTAPFDVSKADLVQDDTTFVAHLPKRDVQAIPQLSVRRV